MVETIETGTYVEPATPPDPETTNQGDSFFDGNEDKDNDKTWLIVVLCFIAVIVVLIIVLLLMR